MFVEKPQPQGTDTLPIRGQALDAFGSDVPQEPSHQADALSGMGISTLIEPRPEERDREPFIGHREDENIEIHRPQLPIRAIQAERPGGLQRPPPHDECRKQGGSNLERLKNRDVMRIC